MVPQCENHECENERDKHESVEGSYCSYACYYRHKGLKLLSDIEQKHTHCASCGKRLKEIQKPTELHPDVFIGYQYKTPNAEWGEKTYVQNKRWDDFDTTGTICKNCGTTDHKDSYLREFHFGDFIKRVLFYFREKYKTGGLESPLNERVFFDSLKDGFSLEYSLGISHEDSS